MSGSSSSAAAAGASPPPRMARTPANPKARPAVPPWKAALLKRCEEQVARRRAELVRSARARGSVEGVLADLLAEQDAAMRDDGDVGGGGGASGGGSTGGLRARTLRRLASPAGGGYDDWRGGGGGDDDDAEAGLTEEERLAFLLHLQEELLQGGDASPGADGYDGFDGDGDGVCDEDAALVERLVADYYGGGGDGGGGGGGGQALQQPPQQQQQRAGAAAASPYDEPPLSEELGVYDYDVDDEEEVVDGDDGGAGGGESVLCPMCRRHRVRQAVWHAQPHPTTGSASATAAAASMEPYPPPLPRYNHHPPLAVLACRCGFALDCGGGGGGNDDGPPLLSVAHLASALAGAYDQHRSQGCPAEPRMVLYTADGGGGASLSLGSDASCGGSSSGGGGASITMDTGAPPPTTTTSSSAPAALVCQCAVCGTSRLVVHASPPPAGYGPLPPPATASAPAARSGDAMQISL